MCKYCTFSIRYSKKINNAPKNAAFGEKNRITVGRRFIRMELEI